VSAASSELLGPAELYPRLREFVQRSLAGLGVAASDTEDLTHDVFVTLHQKDCRFSHERAARAWLYGTARRLASNRRRAADRARARVPAWQPAELPAPDEVVQWRAARREVDAFAAELPDDARAVFRLSELEGRAAPEVADELGLNLNTTYSHIRRVRRRWARRVAVGLGLVTLFFVVFGGTCRAADHAERPAVRSAAELSD
jgi:RNA polymerase sigma-70 factor (ECF subfamily)